MQLRKRLYSHQITFGETLLHVSVKVALTTSNFEPTAVHNSSLDLESVPFFFLLFITICITLQMENCTDSHFLKPNLNKCA